MLMRIVTLLMPEVDANPISPDFTAAEVLRILFHPYSIVDPAESFLVPFKCVQDVSCLTASINRFVHRHTVSLTASCLVVVNHIPLSKRITVLCGSNFVYLNMVMKDALSSTKFLS
jgi:hypothetical protein